MPENVCKTSIPGSNPGGASKNFLAKPAVLHRSIACRRPKSCRCEPGASSSSGDREQLGVYLRHGARITRRRRTDCGCLLEAWHAETRAFACSNLSYGFSRSMDRHLIGMLLADPALVSGIPHDRCGGAG